MPQVRRDLSLSNTNYALAVNAFLVMYMIFYILGGRLADRLGCRRTVTLTLLFWSLASMAHTLVSGLRSLALCRALLGVGEAGFYPAAMRGAAEWFPPESRAKAVGMFLSALSVGTLLTPPIVAGLTIHYGWRAAFLATGALGLLLVPPWLLLHRRVRQLYGTPDPAPARQLETSQATDLTLLEVLRRRKYWCLLTARAAGDAAWYFYLFWMPGYFQEVRKLDLATVGRLLWIPYLAAGLGALAGAWASSALMRRGLGLDPSRKSILYASAVLCVAGASACFAPGSYLALTLVSLALFGHQSWSSNIHTVILEITPPAHVAVLYGITGAAGTLMGALAQLVIGPVVDSTGYTPVFVGAGLLYVLALSLLTAAGKIEPIARNAAPGHGQV
jgi:ACS family hexuronate transporter-like MFS transporter